VPSLCGRMGWWPGRTTALGRTPLPLAPSSVSFNQMLEECHILLSLQETDLNVHEVKLVEEQAPGMHPFVGWNLLAEPEKLRARMADVEDKHAIEAGKLSMLVVGISNALVDLKLLPI
jgi:hypothetical protein